MLDQLDLVKYEGHTPGPWTDGDDFDHSKQKNSERAGCRYLDIVGSDKKTIIECDAGFYGPYGADRCLIIDAPLLLEKLKEAYAEIERLENSIGDLKDRI